MDRDKKVRAIVRKMGKKMVVAKDSTFKYQQYGSKVLEEFKRNREAERAKKSEPVLSIVRDGTEG
jgi:hypothetical protein